MTRHVSLLPDGRSPFLGPIYRPGQGRPLPGLSSDAARFHSLSDLAWLPSDLTGLFTTATGGTNPVPGDPVGLMLDCSQFGGKTAAQYMAANGITDPTLVPGKHFKQTTAGARPILVRYPKSGVRNRFTVGTTALSSTTVAVTAVPQVLSFKGTGTVTLSGASTAGPLVGTGANDRVQLTFTPSAGTLTLTVTGSVTDAQLELGSTATPYQRVTNAYDVTESGQPDCYGLMGDGLSKCMVTDAVNPGTDKVTVVAGVRKLSDAAVGIVAELSATVGANNGAFALQAPAGTGSPSIGFLAKGTALAVATSTSIASPFTGIITGIGDIAADTAITRVNGVQVAADTATNQGTGNYGSYPLFLMARNQASSFFNGIFWGGHISWKNHAANDLAFIERQMAKNVPEVTL